MRRNILVNLIAYFFIVLFLYTGGNKLTEPHFFKEQLISSPLLGSMAGFATWALPIGEILLAIALFIPASRLKALYATCAVMTLFTVYFIIILLMDNQLSCSCGGILEELSPKQHIFFNTTCIFLSGLAIKLAKQPKSILRFKWLINTAAIGAFLFIAWTIFVAFSAPVMGKTGFEGRLLPSFKIFLSDSITYLNTNDIPLGKPFIIVGFSPTCKHCAAETENIIRNIDRFKGMRIYFVTPYPFSEMKGFYRYFKISKYPSLVMGTDTNNFFMSYFKAEGVPFTAIFDSKKRLKQAMGSQANADNLIKVAAE